MTQDEIAKLIPDNVKEAVARNAYERDSIGWPTDIPPRAWEHIPDRRRQGYLKAAVEDLAAGLAAWGGMYVGTDYLTAETQMKLPLQEPTP